MDMHRMTHRGAGVLLAAALATALLAPAAEAGRHGPYRHGHGHGPVIIERHSDAGAVVGFLGGLVLGTIISNAQSAPPPVCERAAATDYEFYDPWCRTTFGSLDRYEDHLDRHRHPRTAEVVDVRSGRCVDTVRWSDGRWFAGDEQALIEDDRAPVRDDRAPVGHDRSGDTPPYEEWDD
jgi:hypothetical protein